MQEPTNMFVLCAPIKVLPAGYIVQLPACQECKSARKMEKKNQHIHLSLRSMLSVIHDLQTTTRFTTHPLHVGMFLDKINVLFYYIFFDPSG